MVMEGDLTLGGEHTIWYTDHMLWNCTPETCIILLTNITSINSVKILKKRKSLKLIAWVSTLRTQKKKSKTSIKQKKGNNRDKTQLSKIAGKK